MKKGILRAVVSEFSFFVGNPLACFFNKVYSGVREEHKQN